ncbi:MAG: hypothetical protein A2086_10180 [Spirochaetes bacterium GWD1_27_9]|nr:MAG: hypothetical protein A2Z98_08075 [Spirochaetes bacterium GWB1_27_13]OHD35796.1 MAG: hypothetical protein A2086_10180 [Spirochaetes bacterium GWD1_27_9]
MIKNNIEEFNINECPLCKKKHILKVDVYRDILPNNLNKDVRVPEFKRIPVTVFCPKTKLRFNMEIYIQEDKFSTLIKIKRVV